MAKERSYYEHKGLISKSTFIGAIIGGVLGAGTVFLNRIYILPFAGLRRIMNAFPLDIDIPLTAFGVLIGGGIGKIISIYRPFSEANNGSLDTGAVMLPKKADHDTNGISKLQILEEKLDVSKRRLKTGEVFVHKELITEEKNIKVPVTREELVIRKKKLDVEGNKKIGGDSETIRIPIREERIEIRKHPIDLEKVRIYKRKTKSIEHVEETLKKEKVKVETTGDVKVIDIDRKK